MNKSFSKKLVAILFAFFLCANVVFAVPPSSSKGRKSESSRPSQSSSSSGARMQNKSSPSGLKQSKGVSPYGKKEQSAKPKSPSGIKAPKANSAPAKKPTSSNKSISFKREKGEHDELIIGIILVLFALSVIACIHMPIALLFPRNASVYNKKKDFAAIRKKRGLEESTPEENATCSEILEKGFSNWCEYEGNSGRFFAARSPSAYKSGLKSVKEVAKIMPTDPEICDKYNSACNLLKADSARSLSCSPFLLSLVIVVMGVVIFFSSKENLAGEWSALVDWFRLLPIVTFSDFVSLTEWKSLETWGSYAPDVSVLYTTVPFLFLSLVFYIFASLRPRYLKRYYELDSSQRESAGCLMGFLVAMLALADNSMNSFTRTTTKWSDGTTTVEDDHTTGLTFAGIYLAIAIVVIVITVALMSVFALLNYFRNYVFYI